MTFEARPLCNLTRCTPLFNSDMPMKLDIMIAKASNIDGLNILFHIIYIPMCSLEIKSKLLNLCLMVYIIENLVNKAIF